jgi:hypothetical protein
VLAELSSTPLRAGLCCEPHIETHLVRRSAGTRHGTSRRGERRGLRHQPRRQRSQRHGSSLRQRRIPDLTTTFSPRCPHAVATAAPSGRPLEQAPRARPAPFVAEARSASKITCSSRAARIQVDADQRSVTPHGRCGRRLLGRFGVRRADQVVSAWSALVRATRADADARRETEATPIQPALPGTVIPGRFPGDPAHFALARVDEIDGYTFEGRGCVVSSPTAWRRRGWAEACREYVEGVGGSARRAWSCR